MPHYDVVVLGCGPGGERAAIQAARAGKAGRRGRTRPRGRRHPCQLGHHPLQDPARERALRSTRSPGTGSTASATRSAREITVADFMYRERAVVQRELELINESLGALRASRSSRATRASLDPHAVARSRRRTAPRCDAHRRRHTSSPPARARTGPTTCPSTGDRLRHGDDPASCPACPKTHDGSRGRGRRDRVREHLRRPRHRGHPGRHPRPAAARTSTARSCAIVARAAPAGQ